MRLKQISRRLAFCLRLFTLFFFLITLPTHNNIIMYFYVFCCCCYRWLLFAHFPAFFQLRVLSLDYHKHTPPTSQTSMESQWQSTNQRKSSDECAFDDLSSPTFEQEQHIDMWVLDYALASCCYCWFKSMCVCVNGTQRNATTHQQQQQESIIHINTYYQT